MLLKQGTSCRDSVGLETTPRACIEDGYSGKGPQGLGGYGNDGMNVSISS
jgi:hypothetical protein